MDIRSPDFLSKTWITVSRNIYGNDIAGQNKNMTPRMYDTYMNRIRLANTLLADTELVEQRYLSRLRQVNEAGCVAILRATSPNKNTPNTEHRPWANWMYNDQRQKAHLYCVVYILVFGIPDPGSILDHKCRNGWCLNPAHIEAVTPRLNSMNCDTRGKYDTGNGGASCDVCGSDDVFVSSWNVHDDRYLSHGVKCKNCRKQRYRIMAGYTPHTDIRSAFMDARRRFRDFIGTIDDGVNPEIALHRSLTQPDAS